MTTAEGQYVTPTEDSPIDLRTLWLIILRRRFPFLIVAAVVLAIGLGIALIIPSKYVSSTSVLIERRSTNVAEGQSIVSGLPADSAAVDTEVQVLRSPDLARRVAERLHLDRDPEFNPRLREPGFGEWLGGLFGKSPAPVRPGLDAVTNALLNHMSIGRQGLTYVININVSSRSPQTAADIANAMAREYLEQQAEYKRAVAQKAQNFYSERMRALSTDVQSNASSASSIRARTGITSGSNPSSYDEQTIADLRRQHSEASANLAAKQARYSAASRSQNNPSSLPDVLASQVIRDLRSQRAKIAVDASQATTRYGNDHPEVASTRNQLAEIDGEIAAETRRIVSGLAAEVNAAQQEVASLGSAIAQQRSAAIRNSDASVTARKYDTDADASREVYEDLAKRRKETVATDELATPDASIVSVASPPNSPSSPNRPLLILLTLAAALTFGLLAIIIAELLDVKISSGEDVKRHLGLNRIASIPGVSPRNYDEHLARLVYEKPQSSFSEAIRALNMTLRGGHAKQALPSGQVIVITSALPHEGKTTIATSLALSIAKAGSRVLLIDADVRRPQVAASLGIATPEHGIAEVATGKTELASAIVSTGTPLDLLLVTVIAKGIDIFSRGQFSDLLEKARQQYDVVVIDTPPVLAVSDATVISREADHVVFITRWRRTSRFAAKAAVEALKAAEAPLSGVVLNAVDLKKQSLYADSDPLAFYGSYKAYYANEE